MALSGIHDLRHHRIIRVLDPDEQERIKLVTEDNKTPLRYSAIMLKNI